MIQDVKNGCMCIDHRSVIVINVIAKIHPLDWKDFNLCFARLKYTRVAIGIYHYIISHMLVCFRNHFGINRSCITLAMELIFDEVFGEMRIEIDD